jgi:uncharacterized protein DUF1592/uncharacterized protein DUF1588/uncharacterized protein DUF1587/uncharacterized protein DUF1595/uncharacterized protein DUF1585
MRVLIASLAVACAGLTAYGAGGASGPASQRTEPPAATPAAPTVIAYEHDGDRMTAASQTALLQTICVQCHTDQRKPGGVSFEHMSMDAIGRDPELAERMIAKLRAGMMPPASAPKRPDDSSVHAFVVSLENRIDEAARAQPQHGSRRSQRLNRAEYARSIRAMLGLDIDVTAWLPPDTMSHNFDNIAAVQDFSPTLLQSYLDAASEISRLAVGDLEATPTSVSYDVPQFVSQTSHIEGAPLGTRGGLSVEHVFPADGKYRCRLRLFSTLGGRLFGLTTIGERIQIAIDDRQVAMLDVDPRMSEAVAKGLTLETEPIDVTAGPHRVSAAFVEAAEGPVDDLIAPQAYTLADLDIGDAKGLTVVPHLRTLTIDGPFAVTGVSGNVSRERIFVCRPTAPADEIPCARTIIVKLAEQAYRGRVSEAQLQDLMRFYAQGRASGGFEAGIRLALQAMLASPHFLFRIEADPGGSAPRLRSRPATLRPAQGRPEQRRGTMNSPEPAAGRGPGQPASARAGGNYEISDRALASRLSFFLWSEPPDSVLLKLADRGQLHELTVLDAQVRRMLADPRSLALSTRFAAQWLRLQDVAKVRPDAVKYPTYDGTIERDLIGETELFFDSIVRNDVSVLDLLSADYTYANDRLAKYYGIPSVVGPSFRRVSLEGTHRRGLLGQGSILVETSVATRTNPVLRGKWVLEVLLGQPPPPPPPNIPPFDATAAVSADGRPLSVRQRMEQHRRNPFCASCHRMIDPIGLALEHFEPTGQWRIADNDVPVDASTVLYDGTPMNGLDGLVQALLKHQDTFLRVFTQNLMAYALGRDVQFFDMPAVRSIVARADRNGNRFSSYVLGIVNSDAFRTNRASEENLTDAAAAPSPKRF